jgi:hypothetical protein
MSKTDLEIDINKIHYCIPVNWNMQNALAYRWINPKWFDGVIFENLSKINLKYLLSSTWQRMIDKSLNILFIDHLIDRQQTILGDYDLVIKEIHSFNRICSFIISLGLVPQTFKFIERILSKWPESRIVAAIHFYIDGLLTNDNFRELIEWDLENLSSVKNIGFNINQELHRLPSWFIHQFLLLNDIEVTATLLRNLTEYHHLLCRDLGKFKSCAIEYMLRSEWTNEKLINIGVSKEDLLSYEQLYSHPDSIIGLNEWLNICNKDNQLHIKILKHKLIALTVSIEWDRYNKFIDIEWLGLGNNIIKLASQHHLSSSRARLIIICKILLDRHDLISKYDFLHLILKFHQYLPLYKVLLYINLSINSKIYREFPSRLITNEIILQFLSELICDLYGPRFPKEQFLHIDWDGENPLTLWKSIESKQGIIRFSNGGAFDAGGVSREFHSILGKELIKCTYEKDGYRIPTGDMETWGGIISRIVAWDRQAIGIDLHPLVCVMLCWGWLNNLTEPYPYAAISALLDKDILQLLAPMTMYRIQEACQDPESSLQPCVEFSIEIKERFFNNNIELKKSLDVFTASAGAPLNISPRRLFRMIGGGNIMNLNALFAALEVTMPEQSDGQSEIFKNALEIHMRSSESEYLEELYRFWFGTIRPNYDDETPILSIVSEMQFSIAKSHVCISQLNIPFINSDDNEVLLLHISTCISRALTNQRIASSCGMHYQFR